MRDPKRIDNICQRLADAWKRVPDLRLIQLLENATSCNYYMEDVDAIRMVEQFASKCVVAHVDADVEYNNEDYMGGF